MGNELTNDRPWGGEIRCAVVHVGNTAVDYAQEDALELSPARFRYTPRSFTLVPFAEAKFQDMAINLIGYIPLGLLLGLWGCGRGRSRWRCALSLTLVACAVSAGMETLQFAVATRHPSTTDLILNSLGGGIGVLLGLWARFADRPSLFRARLRSGTAPTQARNRAN